MKTLQRRRVAIWWIACS